MQFCEEEIFQITENVWNSILGLKIGRRECPLLEACEERSLTGYVQYTGAWHGAFLLDCSFSLARRIAAIMFRFETAQTSVEDICDALGEMANITGGNVKGLLPEPCRLALPVVVIDGSSSALHLLGSQIVTQINLECEQEPFRVTLLSLPKGATADDNSREFDEA